MPCLKWCSCFSSCVHLELAFLGKDLKNAVCSELVLADYVAISVLQFVGEDGHVDLDTYLMHVAIGDEVGW